MAVRGLFFGLRKHFTQRGWCIHAANFQLFFLYDFFLAKFGFFLHCLESFDFSLRIDKFHLSGKERVAFGTNFEFDLRLR